MSGKKKRVKLSVILTLMVAIPSIITGIVSVNIMVGLITNYSEDQVKKELHATGIAGLQAYDFADAGDYVELADGKVSKGTLLVSENYDMMDSFKKNTGLEATFFYGNERVSTTLSDEAGNRLIGTSADQKIVDQVIGKGEDYYSSNVIINEKRYCGYYLPVKQTSTGETIGMYFVGKNYEDVMNELDKEADDRKLIPIIIVIVVCTGVTIIFAFYITNRIKQCVRALNRIANGKLTHVTAEKLQNDVTEIGELGRATEQLRNSLQEIIHGIKKTDQVISASIAQSEQNANAISDVTKDVEHAMDQIAEGSSSQAKSTEDAAMAVSHMGDLVEANTKQTEILLKNSRTMDQVQKEVVVSLENLQHVNEKSKEAIREINKQTNQTNQSVQEIKKAANFITDIAEETNLLSLNATIEAARAGEHGKGFAVVAAQIQKLAEQSNESAKQITEVISHLIMDSEKSLESMNEVTKVMEEQSSNVESTKNMFRGVVSSIKENDQLSEAIHQSMEQMNTYRNTIIELVSNLSALSQENAASTEETASACENLKEIARESLEEMKKMQEMSDELTGQIRTFQLS
ncbi:methyl-accepting chemotaxis protein [Anaerosporobacter faecicola]|uniref:methyl-accepting chemotaxis protein n=1 Tax=Anaerosporobacter faecicola TaxID=2718714 RepID=UPI00143C4A82|nr:methyl-accepting chemotaxis protein [Anaerosporobacter faecicola]